MINYKRVVDMLEKSIPDNKDCRFYKIEMTESYSNGKTIILIELVDTDRNDGYNKYRLYHSELIDIESDKELLECCLNELKSVYDNIKWTMCNILSKGYIILSEMEG